MSDDTTLKVADTTLNVASWNVENFVVIGNDLSDNDILSTFRKQDIILIQEWKENKGLEFVKKLNENDSKFSTVYIKDKDNVLPCRVAIIYNNKKLVNVHSEEVLLEPEKPTSYESLYMHGNNYPSLVGLFLISNTYIGVANFHLSSLNDALHPEFHSSRLSDFYTKSNDIIKKKTDKPYDFIIGGDTNYRKDTDLIGLIKSKSEYLKDVCDTKEGCLKISTQWFECVHEKGIGKDFAKKCANAYAANPNSAVSQVCRVFDNKKQLEPKRLDFVATTMEYKNTQILKQCPLSDHSAIFTEVYFSDPVVIGPNEGGTNFKIISSKNRAIRTGKKSERSPSRKSKYLEKRGIISKTRTRKKRRKTV